MSIIRKFTAKIGFGERRRDGRVGVSYLEASYWTGVEQKRVRVKDVSPTGVYVVTDDRWLPGTNILLTLQNAQKRSLFDDVARPEVRMAARTVRTGEDGVGLTFVQDHIKTSTWLKLMNIATSLVVHNDAVRVFRVTKALAFLLRICPSCEEQVLKLIAENMSNERCERAIEVALRAEEIIVSQNRTPGTGLPPGLVLHILENGSEIGDDRLQQSWGGMLAASSLEASTPEAILRYIELLSALDPCPIRILTAACARAMEVGWKSKFVFDAPLVCSLAEIKKIAGARTMVGIEQDLNRLYQLGLLERTEKVNSLDPIQEPNLTPTALGLQLYARCTGQISAPEALEVPEPETVSSSDTLAAQAAGAASSEEG